MSIRKNKQWRAKMQYLGLVETMVLVPAHDQQKIQDLARALREGCRITVDRGQQNNGWMAWK